MLSRMLSHKIRLLTDPPHSTQQGNIFQKDTSPDLNSTNHIANSVCRHTGHDLECDHYVVETIIEDGPPLSSTRSHNVVEGVLFRFLCDAHLPDQFQDFEYWTGILLEQHDGDIEPLPEQDHLHVGGSHLHRYYKARQGLVRRIQRKKLNPLLCRRLAKLNMGIRKHAKNTAPYHWNAFCDHMRQHECSADLGHSPRCANSRQENRTHQE
ncbi:hypothetical protein HPB48_008126 [Haemaphysalis longicornis]|uniref:Uncharacterized protein n=1 Tax=Haemaphysalis longicornis TaxID=44386 RepID=A0A9J6FV58_HAELO|nr:hypothetical protein HPB48_008126 [Haemaphysalis longicornis]